MPKLGESVLEATITRWNKKIGDVIEEDDAIVEIATDKVDSEVPSPVAGKLMEILFQEGEVVAVGSVIARLAVEGMELSEGKDIDDVSPMEDTKVFSDTSSEVEKTENNNATESRFYSPLVRKMAKEENISIVELESIIGSGAGNRVTKDDVTAYISKRNLSEEKTISSLPATKETKVLVAQQQTIQRQNGDEIIEMSRMRKLIADHMVASVHTSPHVTSFIEVDMTPAVFYREKNKNIFEKNFGTKLTFTHLIMHAAAKALREFPMINSSVSGSQIILHKNINFGFATVLPDGNLIVPVVKNADLLNLEGLTTAVNDLAARARENTLQPDEIQGGTFTFTNLGSFGSFMGTPIINQPQVAILAAGVITKKPVVIESELGDTIAIRQMMMMSLSYDHRVVDGGLGGLFIKKVKEILETLK